MCVYQCAHNAIFMRLGTFSEVVVVVYSIRPEMLKHYFSARFDLQKRVDRIEKKKIKPPKHILSI